METITIPDALAARLRAEANRSTLDAEATRLLEGAVANDHTAPREASLVEQIRVFRESLPIRASGEEIVRMIREDRDSDHGRS